MIREPWSAANLSAVKSKIATYETLAMKHLADNMLEQLAADEVLNQKDRKIGGIFKWEEAADLIFFETTEKECSNKKVKGLMKDERSMVIVFGNAVFGSHENFAEVMKFAINLTNQMIAGEVLQMVMLSVMQTIRYTCYKKQSKL